MNVGALAHLCSEHLQSTLASLYLLPSAIAAEEVAHSQPFTEVEVPEGSAEAEQGRTCPV